MSMRNVRRLILTPPQVRNRLALAALAALALALLTPDLGASPICHWTDDTGRAQFSDVVPDQYKDVARCVNSQQFELTPQQRQEAELRAAEERTRARSRAANSPKGTAPSAPRPTEAASQPGARAKRPSEVVTDATDCPTWWRLYDESSDCFGPYRMTRGGIKPEAFDNCNVVPSPEVQCGPRRN